MQIQPMNPEKIRITQIIPAPILDSGARLPQLDIIEYETRWTIYVGLKGECRIIIGADGKLYINEIEYIPPCP